MDKRDRKEYYEKNKEKIKEYYENNKEKIKQYRLKNKEKIKEQKKEYNKEYMKEYNKQYKKTENGIKYNRINNWKTIGVIHDDYHALYEHYINTTECNVCKCNFTDKNIKCLDHDHTNGQFRYILCKNCNHYDNWKKKLNLFI